jgi:hypothetical protein
MRLAASNLPIRGLLQRAVHRRGTRTRKDQGFELVRHGGIFGDPQVDAGDGVERRDPKALVELEKVSPIVFAHPEHRPAGERGADQIAHDAGDVSGG